MRKRDLIKHLAIVLVLISLLPATAIHRPKLKPAAVSVPSPLLAHQHPVDWWFVFKLNASKFPIAAALLEHARSAAQSRRTRSVSNTLLPAANLRL